MTQNMRRGRVVPNFTLPDAGGLPVRRSAYRGRKHLALVFVSASTPIAETLVRDLASVYDSIRQVSAEVLVIVRGKQADAQRLATAGGGRFPVLVDGDGAVSATFLPVESAAVFLTDRYGELYATLPAGEPAVLPASEVVAWLTAIDNQCSI